jgi:Zn-dependent peptidase ImmA (M78 family)
MLTDISTVAKAPDIPRFEIDRQAEGIINEHLRRLYGELRFPVPIEALQKLLERFADTVDWYADLSNHAADADGVTQFVAGQKPVVRISKDLMEGGRETRQRNTCGHECGHLYLHDNAVQALYQQGQLINNDHPGILVTYRDGSRRTRRSSQWEAQAIAFSGALLMPASQVLTLVDSVCEGMGQYEVPWPGSRLGQLVEELTAVRFGVSAGFARGRLISLRCLGRKPTQTSLF